MNVRIIMAMVCLVPLPLYAQILPKSAEVAYCKNLNQGLVWFYIDHNEDSAGHYLSLAEQIFPNAVSNEYGLLSQIRLSKRDTAGALSYLAKELRWISAPTWDDTVSKLLAGYAPFIAFRQNFRVSAREWKTDLDNELSDLITFNCGREQYVRMLPYKMYGISRETWAKMMHDIDSANYVALKEYFVAHSITDVYRLLSLEAIVNLNVMLNHFICQRIDSLNGAFFRNFIANESAKGQYSHTLLPYLQDYCSGAPTQQLGCIKYSSGDKLYFKAIDDIENVDRLRAAANLPPLLVDAVRHQIEIPRVTVIKASFLPN